MLHPGMYRGKPKKRVHLDPITKKVIGRRTLEQMDRKDLIKVLDREYSLYRRMSAADRHVGYVQCVTCWRFERYNFRMELGHYITRGIEATRFDDRNTAPQCTHCNGYMGGMVHEMRAYLVRTYGEEEIASMEQRSRMGSPWNTENLIEAIKKYRELNKGLKKELKGL